MQTPEQVREYARSHDMATTAGHARGFMQANLLAVPQEYAFDFLLFAPVSYTHLTLPTI